MMKHFKYFLFVAGFCAFAACRSDTQRYEEVVAREQATGIRHDSIFMGIKLGMSSKEFYTHCWIMNKKGLFFEGPGNTTVLYHFKNELKHPGAMTFYPDFRQDKINKMGVLFSYDAFAPWNKALFADSLQLDVLNLFKKWYKEGDFITLTDPTRGTIYVQVKGNRRIIIGKYDEQRVKVDFTDLSTESNNQQ